MTDFLYIINKKYARDNPVYDFSKTCKIGSTQNFVKRMSNYVTPEAYFNNDTHDIYCIKITKSKWNCYELDKIIQYASSKYSTPYKKLMLNDGGTEHYKYNNDPNSLTKFLDLIDVEYEFSKIDINILRTTIAQISKKEAIEQLLQDEIDDIILENGILSEIDNRIGFRLKKYQEEMRNIIATTKQKERLFHLIISPTGTGKTVVFTIAGIDAIATTKKSIMILTKRKEILDQMKRSIVKYIRQFNESGSTKLSNDDIEIVDCLEECTINKLNKKSNKHQIYIVNFDKFTSSNKMKKFSEIDFDKFDTIIVDESHWCGAKGISDFMTKIKNETKVNVIGFSATPLRCQKFHRERTEKLFSNEDCHLNILHEYSYYDALVNLDICPIEWTPISMKQNDFVDAEDNENEENDGDCCDIVGKKYKVLSNKSYSKVWKNITDNIIQKSFKRKGVLCFRQRRDLLLFYKYMCDELNDFSIYISISYEKGDNVGDLVRECGLTKEHFDNAINEFIEEDDNALLFVVNRATEGFNDDIIDFFVRMYYSICTDPVAETQRMGRLNRWFNNDPSKKKKGYFVTLEISDIEDIRKSIILRLKSWIIFARSYGNNGGNGSVKKIEQMEEIINKYVSADILKTHNIDLKQDIINAILNKRKNSLTEIKGELAHENNKRKIKGEGVINTTWLYDKWALDNDYPICDELEEENKKIDWKWFFGIKNNEYVTFAELKKICGENRPNNIKPDELPELYKAIQRKYSGIPSEPDKIYKNFDTYINLFY